MTKMVVEKIMEEEGLTGAAYNLLEDRPDGVNEVVVRQDGESYMVYQTDEQAKVLEKPKRFISTESAFDIFLSKLRDIKTKKYNQFFEDANAARVLREMISKTFVSSHDFDTTYHELYKTDNGRYFSVVRIDPAPGGYGEEFMYIREVYELEIDVAGKSYSDEKLMALVFSDGKKMELSF